jgi:hypothetical protein
MRRLLAALLTAICPLAAATPEPLFSEDFEAAETGKLPKGFTAFSGAFKVQQAEGRKFLELPGAPLDTFGVLFGPAAKPPLDAQASFYATQVKRKMPAFGVSLSGVGGYRLQVSAAKGQLEIFKADHPLVGVPFSWKTATWTTLRIRTREAGGKWLVEGKAWPADAPEPAEWSISYEAPEPPQEGRAGVWGNPFSGTPIRFDDLKLRPAAP